MIPDVWISEDAEARLGPEGVAAVTDSLWPVDCQSCGKRLGSQPVALAVDQVADDAAMASLHHSGCRGHQWNDSGVIAFNTTPTSHRSMMVMMQASGLAASAGANQLLPVMIVNPSLECVQLYREDGRWVVHPDADFVAAGLTSPDDNPIPLPIPGASATLTAASIAVTLRARPEIVYQVGLDGQDEATQLGRHAIRSQDGILLMVTHAVDPAATSDLSRQFTGALQAGQVLTGWVGLDRPAKPS